MSEEIFELAKKCDINSIQTQLALQCAPVISGLKISNLLIIPDKDRCEVRKILLNTGISYFVLLRKSDRTTLLLYNKEKLRDYLSRSEISEFMHNAGYNDSSMSRLLYEFKLRYEAYMEGEGEFPHEMGILLGYPIEDVEGFIVNEGKNSLCTGYWKVYDNVGQKIALFERFEHAKANVIRLMSRGRDIGDIIRIYKLKRDILNAEITVDLHLHI